MADEQRWQARFRAPRVSLPTWAAHAPHRCVYQSNATGVWEVYAWDRSSGTTRQVTARDQGTRLGRIDARGEEIWWFCDTDGDEFGVWHRQPFLGGVDEVAIPDLDPAFPAGIAFGASGLVVAGCSADKGTAIRIARPGELSVTCYEHTEDAYLVDLSRDERLIALSHSEHGDSRHQALRVIDLGGETVAELWDGPGLALHGVGFSPLPGDRRLLVVHERRGRPEPLIWDPESGEQREIQLDLPGETTASWYQDGQALLIVHDYQARSTLLCYELATSSLEAIDTPRGAIDRAKARPDRTVEYLWSNASTPPVVQNTRGETVLHPPGEPAPHSVPVDDHWVAGPGGDVHVLVSTPPQARPPYPTVFCVHGGPTSRDDDSFRPQVAMWVDHGFAVVRVNYRGSTGYGSAWRDALEHRVGLTELEDIAAARKWAVTTGLADARRLVLNGWSWGGFLTLLGMGRHADDWSLGIAGVPVADYVAAYADEMEPLQAFDRALFGGTPEQVPQRYLESSPISYVDRVRAPVLILAGENDPRCPIRQIDNYVAALVERGIAHEVVRYAAGHGSLVIEDRLRQHAAEIDFALRHLGAGGQNGGNDSERVHRAPGTR